MHLLFVYGTLKQGFGNHRILEGQELLDDKYCLEGFEMRSFGWFPVVNPKEGSQVFGELYRVDDTALARCDRLEGHPSFYQRHVVDDGVFVYVQQGDAVAHLPVIEEGEW